MLHIPKNLHPHTSQGHLIKFVIVGKWLQKSTRKSKSITTTIMCFEIRAKEKNSFDCHLGGRIDLFSWNDILRRLLALKIVDSAPSI